MADMSVNVAGVTLKNPVMTASGTLPGMEYSEFVDLSRLGAVDKGSCKMPRGRAIRTRVWQIRSGMMNAIGL